MELLKEIPLEDSEFQILAKLIKAEEPPLDAIAETGAKILLEIAIAKVQKKSEKKSDIAFLDY